MRRQSAERGLAAKAPGSHGGIAPTEREGGSNGQELDINLVRCGRPRLFAAGRWRSYQFNAALAIVLNGQTSGPLAKMDATRKQRMIDCVTGVLSRLPKPSQRQIAAGADFEDIQDRFGKVVMANRAEWKQKIARTCGKFAV
jgi:hypothetical protein